MYLATNNTDKSNVLKSHVYPIRGLLVQSLPFLLLVYLWNFFGLFSLSENILIYSDQPFAVLVTFKCQNSPFLAPTAPRRWSKPHRTAEGILPKPARASGLQAPPCPSMHQVSCIIFRVIHFGVIQPFYRSDFTLLPKLKSPLKGKRFQTIDKIQENLTRQLMVVRAKDFAECFLQQKRRWENFVKSQGANFEGDRGIIVICAMFPVSSSINVSSFHITWCYPFIIFEI